MFSAASAARLAYLERVIKKCLLAAMMGLTFLISSHPNITEMIWSQKLNEREHTVSFFSLTLFITVESH